ncbi:MAG: NUDIX domain-containing protein [Pseudomonadota bacterium]
MKAAVVGVIRRAGRVIVIQRGPGALLSGYWSPPSGRIEPGESQEQTVVREMREELGLEVRPLAKVWECETDDGGFLLHWWTVAEDGGELILDPDEVGAAKWVTPAEFLMLQPTFRGDREFFQSVLPTIK